MARRKDIRSRAQYHSALELEKSGDNSGAIRGYQKAATTDPTNTLAWNRQMMLYRKSKTRQQEIALIKTAIAQYKNSIQQTHQNWLKANQEKAKNTIELATVLGMIETDGLPKTEHLILEKWQTRLYLLEYRLKNARARKLPRAKQNTKKTNAPPTTTKAVKTKSRAKKVQSKPGK